MHHSEWCNAHTNTLINVYSQQVNRLFTRLATPRHPGMPLSGIRHGPMARHMVYYSTSRYIRSDGWQHPTQAPYCSPKRPETRQLIYPFAELVLGRIQSSMSHASRDNGATTEACDTIMRRSNDTGSGGADDDTVGLVSSCPLPAHIKRTYREYLHITSGAGMWAWACEWVRR